MAIEKNNLLNDVIDKAKDFIETTKGHWDHIQWNDLLSNFQEKGSQLSDEAKHRFGEVLEGIKGIYSEAKDVTAISQSLNTIKEQAIEFVHSHKEGWDHAAWEELLANLRSSGVDLNRNATAYLGNMLEALKRLNQVKPDQSDSR